MAKAKIVYKFPKGMGACADRLYTLHQQRLDAQKKVDEIESEEKALKLHIINTLPKSESSGVAGKLARVTVVTKEIPQVSDWAALYKHVKKTGQFDLMQRRIASTAVEERWEEGKEVPGVGRFNVTTLSINKV
jgi:hypothetical protein